MLHFFVWSLREVVETARSSFPTARGLLDVDSVRLRTLEASKMSARVSESCQI